MTDIFKNIDYHATKKEVDKVFRQYRTYMLTVPEESMPNITTKFTDEMPSYSNFKRSAVEESAIKNVEFHDFMKWFMNGLTKLSNIERQIIVLSYLQIEPMYDYMVYSKLNISESKYYRIRKRAIMTLAVALGVQKYKQVQDEVKSS